MKEPKNPPAFRHSQDLPRLKALAFEAIREAGAEGATAGEIAGRCMNASAVPRAVADKFIGALLAGDRRVSLTDKGRWVLGDLAVHAEGTPILNARFCVVDVETTGVNSVSRIIEVGAVRVVGLELREEFESFVNVDVPLPPEITSLTGITEAMLEGAPGPTEVLDAFADFLGEDVFCAHNAPFDRRFVFRETEQFCLRSIANPVFCTRQGARRAMPDLDSYSLDALATKLGIRNEARHRALGDAKAAAGVLVASVERLMEQGVRTLEELLRIQRKPEYLKFLKKRTEDEGHE